MASLVAGTESMPSKKTLPPSHPKARQPPMPSIHLIPPTPITDTSTKLINLEHVEPHIQDPGLESEIPRKPITKDIPTILNLSKKELTKAEKEVLSLGLEFAPTPRKTPDPIEYFDHYYEQCQKSYNKLINKPSTSHSPT